MANIIHQNTNRKAYRRGPWGHDRLGGVEQGETAKTSTKGEEFRRSLMFWRTSASFGHWPRVL
jgi:hypothetical protein